MGLWDRHAWDCKISPANMLARWIVKNGLYRDNGVAGSADRGDLPEGTVYDKRLNCYLFPEVIRYWKSKGTLY